MKIDQQILILSQKISAFSAVLGAIFIYICIYRLLWLMSQNILIFCRQKMSQLLNPLTDFQKFWCIVILKDYSFHLNLQIQLFRCYHFSPEIPIKSFSSADTKCRSISHLQSSLNKYIDTVRFNKYLSASSIELIIDLKYEKT